MLRPKRENQDKQGFSKFVQMFGLVMTTLYIVIGVFLMFVDAETLNLNMSKEFKFILGGVLILYGVLRFMKVYQSMKKDRRRYEE